MPQDLMAQQTVGFLRRSVDESDGQLIRTWLHGRSRHTQRAYTADVLRFFTATPKPLSSVTLTDLQAFADSLSDLAPASRYRTLSAIKLLLAFGHRIGYLQFDVGRPLHLPATQDRLAERILPESDVHRMLSLETNQRDRTLLTLLYGSGVRVSEACGLCWRDVQPASKGVQITVFGKGGKTRAIQLSESVGKLLGTLRGNAEDGDPVFRHGTAASSRWRC